MDNNIRSILEAARLVIDAYYLTNHEFLEPSDNEGLQLLMTKIDDVLQE